MLFWFLRVCILTIILSVSTSVSAQGLNEKDFWAAVQTEWGDKAAANRDDIQKIRADITCDGRADYIGGRVNLDDPKQPGFDLLLLTRRKSGEKKAIQFGISFRQSETGGGLCSDPHNDPKPELSLEHYTKKDLKGVFEQPTCTTAIKIDDHMCDSFRFFWLLKPAKDGSVLTLYRN